MTRREQLDPALANLARERSGFRIEAAFPDANEESVLAELDVDAGFLGWSRSAEARAFGPDGTMVEPLEMFWAGDRSLLQLAFARAGLSLQVYRESDMGEAPEDADPDEWEIVASLRGAAMLHPEADTADTDLRRLE